MTISRRDFLKTSSMFAAWTALAACTPLKQPSSELKLPTPTVQSPVLDDDGLLLPHLRQLVGDDPRDDIRAVAGGGGRDDGDRPGRIILRGCRRGGQCRNATCGQCKCQSVHGDLSKGRF